MRDMGIVHGSAESAIPFEICVDTVYLRFGIEPVPPGEDTTFPQGEERESEDGEEAAAATDADGGGGYRYREIQYSLHEWLRILTETVIDTGKFALAENPAKEPGAHPLGEAGIMAAAEIRYAGLPGQKPFTVSTRFTPRKG